MIILAGTPIGNLGDASPRLKEILAEAAIIAAEDTRNARKLLNLLGIETAAQVIALHDHNEGQKAAQLVEAAKTQAVVVVSDAGMPTISDPGLKVVRAAIDAGVDVSCVPGPSAVVTALALSGLPTDRFSFEGFVPRKAGERQKTLENLKSETRTMVFFESPNRLSETLDAMAETFGNTREAAVCRELTKLYEEAKRGTLADLAEWAKAGVKGEIVLVVAGGSAPVIDLDAAADLVRDKQSNGMRHKAAVKEVAAASGLSARDLYQATLPAREG